MGSDSENLTYLTLETLKGHWTLLQASFNSSYNFYSASSTLPQSPWDAHNKLTVTASSIPTRHLCLRTVNADGGRKKGETKCMSLCICKEPLFFMEKSNGETFDVPYYSVKIHLSKLL